MWHIPFYAHTHEAEVHEHILTVALTVIGRIMFSAIFLVSGVTNFVRYRDTVEYAAANGVPMPELLVPLTGLMILVGGLSILLGLYARFGACLLVLFLVPTTLIMHRFWGLTDSNLATAQMAHFMKNTALTGAALLFALVGSGPGSLGKED